MSRVAFFIALSLTIGAGVIKQFDLAGESFNKVAVPVLVIAWFAAYFIWGYWGYISPEKPEQPQQPSDGNGLVDCVVLGMKVGILGVVVGTIVWIAEGTGSYPFSFEHFLYILFGGCAIGVVYWVCLDIFGFDLGQVNPSGCGGCAGRFLCLGGFLCAYCFFC